MAKRGAGMEEGNGNASRTQPLKPEYKQVMLQDSHLS